METVLRAFGLFGLFLVLLGGVAPFCFAQALGTAPVVLRNTVKEFVEKQLANGAIANRLIDEKSPYLLQHAFNPVHWYPWGEEAFAKARRENKPIFLSIGYSTCHWCHVMAHESFENVDIAALLNRDFVAIKVDREERPDLDQVYMAVTQAMTGSGGWPMSLFLTPDLQPFFAGTYFPPQSKYGRPGFPELLESIHETWQKDPADIKGKATEIMKRVGKLTGDDVQAMEVSKNVLVKAARSAAQIYDKQYGGFGSAPKFPRPASLFFLLRYSQSAKDSLSRDMVLKTLREMAKGGMYDQVGGGFHRYSVDQTWLVPHFEKMLYDQAQLAVAYFEAYQVTKDDDYLRVAREILDYVTRDLTDIKGGFYSAEDADSPLPEDPTNHGEGAFYTWSAQDLTQLLGDKRAAIFFARYGVKQGGNVASDPQGEFTGKNILHVSSSIQEVGTHADLTPDVVRNELDIAEEILLTARRKRPRPHLDDKVLASWNGLMIGAFAKGYQVMRAPKYLQAATAAASFVWQELYDAKNGVLLHRYRDGSAGVQANLDDYAFLVQGYLDLFEASSDPIWLERAELLSRLQCTYFADPEQGGFFDSSGTDRTVLLRMKSSYDGAEPTGNSIAALNFLRLGEILASQDDTQRGIRTIKAFGSQLHQASHALPQMLVALEFQLSKPIHIVIAGERDDPETEAMLAEVNSFFLPQKTVLLLDKKAPLLKIQQGSESLAFMTKIGRKATAYVCEGWSCKRPTTDRAVLREMLSKLEKE